MKGRLIPLFLRFRVGALALLCALVVAAFILHRPSLLLAAAIMVAVCVALVQLRYLRLALVVALAPLPGLLWFSAFGYPIAFALASLMAAGLTARLLRGATEEDAFAALFDAMPALAGTAVIAFVWSLWERADFVGLLCAVLAVLLALPVGTIFLPFGEQFHLAANRAREARAPLAETLARLAEVRWAYSLCGIALVFAVLGLFEISGRPPLVDWIGCVLVAVVLHVVTLDWRAGIAGLAAAALLLLFAQGLNAALLLFVLLALFLAQGARRHRDADDIAAWARTIEDHAVPVFFAGLGAALLSGILNDIDAGIDAAAALVAALLVFPALTLAQHHLLPRRRSVEELYKN
jgi:hypothetical protein